MDANMDAEIVEGGKGLVTTAEGVKFVEQLIAKTKNAPVAAADTVPPASVTQAELNDMQFTPDEFGGRKINSDPEFKAEYERKKAALHGTAPYRQMIG